MSGQDDVLALIHENLKEDYENLKQEYESLEKKFKDVEEMNKAMNSRFQNQNQTVELEARHQSLLKEIERERAEKEEYKKMIEEMTKIVAESKAINEGLRKENEEVLLGMEKGEDDLETMVKRHDELAARLVDVEKECLRLKSLRDDAGQEEKDAVITNDVVPMDDDDDVNNNVTSAIVISDESDAENDNHPPRESSLTTQPPLVIKEEVCDNGANSSQANPQPSKVCYPYSSSSSSSDGCVLLQVPVKRALG